MTYLGMQVLIEAGTGRVRHHPRRRHRPWPGAQRLRDAGRGASRDVRPPGASLTITPTVRPAPARRARVLLRRGLLPDADRFWPGGLRTPRPAPGLTTYVEESETWPVSDFLSCGSCRSFTTSACGAHPRRASRTWADRLRRHRHRRRDADDERAAEENDEARDARLTHVKAVAAQAEPDPAVAAAISASRAPLESAGSVRWCRGSRATT